MATNVPSLTFTSTGVDIPDEDQILDGYFADLDQSFGGGVNLELTSPQGQLAQSASAIIGNKNDQIAYVANNIDPDRAEGRWQDAIGRIYFIERIAATGTVVVGRCFGLVGTVVPAGSAAQDVNGYIYNTTADVTIDSSGYADAIFQNSTLGPIACPIGELNRIYTAVNGWDSVNNLSAGSEGTNVEGRAEFEARRRASVALNARGTPQAIRASVLDVEGVIDAYVYDNFESSPVTIGSTNYEIPEKTTYICVAGGNQDDIAIAIYESKSLGSNLTGDVEVVVEETDGYTQPYPSYTMKWQAPVAARTWFQVSVADDPDLPSNTEQLIKDAISSAFSGQDEGERARIGGAIYAGRYFGAAAGVASDLNILEITMAKNVAADQSSIAYGIDELPSLDEDDITVTFV